MRTSKSRLGFSVLALLFLQTQSIAQADDSELVYNGEVGRIINENCVVCHQEGGIAPMAFQSYEQVRPWAPLISYRVANREMPPYAYDHGIGIQNLIGDWRLTQEDIDKVVTWVNSGAPLGDPETGPPPAILKDPSEWNFAAELGQPDLIVPSLPYTIPANGNDLWSKEIVDPGMKVVHHANSSVQIMNDGGELERYGMLTEYAMGKWGEQVPEGVCRTLPAGALIQWSIHMYPGGVGATAPGTMIEDNVVEIGLWFHDESYEEQDSIYKQDLALYRIDEQDDLIIPPHGYQMTQGFHSFDHPVRLDSFQPHGHLRMNAASLEIFYPETGRTEEISQISKWSATWHHNHIFEPDVAPLIPTGAVLILKQWYDNTAANPNNPDPDQWVYGGSRTGDEMTHAWLAITHLDDEGYEKLVAERRAQEQRSIAGND